MTELPKCLKRSLVVGDTEQIKALNEMELAAKEEQENLRKLASGELKKFQVTVDWSATETFELVRANEEEVKEYIRYEMPEPTDWEIDRIDIREKK